MPLHQGYTTIDAVLLGLHLGKFVDQKFQALQIELVFSLLKAFKINDLFHKLHEVFPFLF